LKNYVGKKNAIPSVEAGLEKPESRESETQSRDDFEKLADVKMGKTRAEAEDQLGGESQRDTRH
jgi:hypothetical protein